MTPSPSSHSSCAGNAQNSSSERPERSRNAKAQARHRAKRKAYIEQLEQTVVKLQTIMNLSPEQVAALPPPSVRIRELEQENQRLHHEMDRLRRQLEAKSMQLQQLTVDRRIAFPSILDREDPRDYKRRRMSGEGAYLSPTESPRPDTGSRPSLTLPLPLSHPHATSNSHSSQHSAMPPSSSIYPLEVPSFQMPDTPSGSTASSPSISQPPRMMAMSSPGQSHVPSGNNGHASNSLNGYASHSIQQQLPGVGGHESVNFYGQGTASSQYQLIKMEEDHYYHESPAQADCSPYNAYGSSHSGGGGGGQSDMSSWPAYSADRSQLQQHRMSA